MFTDSYVKAAFLKIIVTNLTQPLNFSKKRGILLNAYSFHERKHKREGTT